MALKPVEALKLIVPAIPLIFSTTLHHITFGPPKPSWTIKLSLTVALIRYFGSYVNHISVKKSQAIFRALDEKTPVLSGVVASPISISKSYRDKAAEHMEKLLNLKGIDAAKLGWDWKNDPIAKEPMVCEWTEMEIKDSNHADGRTILSLHGGGYFLGSIQSQRWASGKMARFGGAKVLAIDYRLAPDSPFPAAVVDAIAAYLFLLHPPTDSGFLPVDPRNLVIMGDSAGGGLAFATMLAIRDAGLPMPAGIVGLSPWLDLLHSMPSMLTNAISDYIPPEGFNQRGLGSFRRLDKLAASVGSDELLLGHQDLPRIQYYASNAVLNCSYVSPLVEKSLEGACSMLLIAGDGEMFRDESFVFAKKNAGASPTLQLLMYDDMPHVFPSLDFLPTADNALEQAGDFVRHVTLDGKPIANKSILRVGVDGRQRPLEEDAVVGWEGRVGKLGGGHEILANLQ